MGNMVNEKQKEVLQKVMDAKVHVVLILVPQNTDVDLLVKEFQEFFKTKEVMKIHPEANVHSILQYMHELYLDDKRAYFVMNVEPNFLDKYVFLRFIEASNITIRYTPDDTTIIKYRGEDTKMPTFSEIKNSLR